MDARNFVTCSVVHHTPLELVQNGVRFIALGKIMADVRAAYISALTVHVRANTPKSRADYTRRMEEKLEALAQEHWVKRFEVACDEALNSPMVVDVETPRVMLVLETSAPARYGGSPCETWKLAIYMGHPNFGRVVQSSHTR